MRLALEAQAQSEKQCPPTRGALEGSAQLLHAGQHSITPRHCPQRNLESSTSDEPIVLPAWHFESAAAAFMIMSRHVRVSWCP